MAKKLKAAMPSWLLPTPVVQEAVVVTVRESERRAAPEEWLSFVGVSQEPRRFTVGRTANGKFYRSIVEVDK